MIASVNGTEITAADVEQEVKSIVMQYQQQVPQDQINAMMPNIQKQAIESVINRQLLMDEANRKEIPVDNDRVQQEIKTIAGRFPSQEAFEQQLTAHGISLQQMEADLGMQFRLDTLIRSYVDKKDINVTEDEVKDFYDKNPDAFQAPEQVKASHILLKVDKDASTDLRTQKRLELAGILGKVEKGADFAQMAQTHSECPSKDKGGDLGQFGRGAMVKSFEEAAFNLEAGGVSDIVETEFGYHIIKVFEKSEAKKEEFDTVKNDIFNHILGSKEQEEFQGFIQTLRDSATIEYAKEA